MKVQELIEKLQVIDYDVPVVIESGRGLYKELSDSVNVVYAQKRASGRRGIIVALKPKS